MKVGTDSILLGSWAAQCLNLHYQSETYKTALDIGCGSGLLALMLSQWSNGALKMTGVEIDQDAALQAKQNVAASPWADSIDVTNDNILESDDLCSSTHDIIISNPPYFPVPARETQSQQGLSAKRKLARSESILTIADLFRLISVSLSPMGVTFVILPSEQCSNAKHESEQNGLFIQRQLDVRSLAEKPVSRVCLALGKTKIKRFRDKLNIYAAPSVYTEEYRDLCRAYYLYF